MSAPSAVDVEVSEEQAAVETKHVWGNCQSKTLNPQRAAEDLLKLQQRPEDAAVPSDGAVRGVDGEHVALRRPQHCDTNRKSKRTRTGDGRGMRGGGR